MTDVEIGVYCHRWSPLQVQAIASVALHTKSHQYAIHVVQKDGNCHVNMNRLWRRFTAPYVVILDEGVTILQDGWLGALLGNLDDDDKLGVVGCSERKSVAQVPLPFPDVEPDAKLEAPRWIPAYVMAFKRERVSDFLWFDEAIPGRMGMTDVDACLQIEQHGLKVGRNPSVVVLHPTRDDDATRVREQRPFTSEQNAWYPEQCNYMTRKWGERFTSLVHR